ncbi:hypothetical protein N7539_006868 [Penicillium diatomitis]|uniref:ER membrane protein complex subunit 10 n=1 Tax=Penicillium diatomitis TaxID=2819901 RepID=A0A9W9X239_9EURO|nr:uncharacterized protein N7539_006868 [Penicillium diatomitis]KAJ5480974.1 hypothetical protein N7539_006868 [Penicillium diatomitis]
MRLLPFLLGTLPSLLLLPSTAASASSTGADSTAEIYYWPLGASHPSTLARIAYDPITLQSNVLAYTPPASGSGPAHEDPDLDLVRLGVYSQAGSSRKQWAGSLVSRASIAEARGASLPTLRLHLGPANEVYHVSVAAAGETVVRSEAGKNVKGGHALGTGAMERARSEGESRGDAAGRVRVQLIKSEAAVQPHLNRPVVVGPDGQNPEEVPEKTLMQKYWWIPLVVMFLSLSGGGGGGGGGGE